MSDDSFIPWTEDGAERLRTAGADLAGAVLAHSEAVIAALPDQDITAVIVAMDRLMPAVAAYGAAQFASTGNGGPFGALAQLVADEDEGFTEPARPTTGISVLRRSDYRVTDEDAVMAAGWAAVERVEGLRPTGSIAAVFARDEVLGEDPDEWPGSSFSGSGELLHRQDDIYPSSEG